MLKAAEATFSLLLRSYEFDNDFRHPVPFAKEAAKLDVLTYGRFVFSIVAGYLRSEKELFLLGYDNASPQKTIA
jgi:alkanesulfonate monooxygenase SsuD/methylene tetrahydromethanopterin reductase-like flavin-dependent oxidoreductase (luciferase family)